LRGRKGRGDGKVEGMEKLRERKYMGRES